MDTKAHYTLVGIMAVVLLGGLIATILWLSVGLNRPTYNTFLIYMDQSVVGLNKEAPVKFNGVDVGYVKDMQLNPKNSQQVIVNLQIREGTPITTSTVATLSPQGITGIAYIGLSANTPNAPLVKTTKTPPFPVIPSEPSLLVQLSSLLKDTSANFQGMSDSVQNMLDAQNAANFKQILINLNKVTASIADNSQDLQQILTQTNLILQNTSTASAQFPEMMAKLNNSITNLNQTTNLIKQGMIPAVRTINHLDTITGDIQSFTNDIKQNPAILLRGKAQDTLGPGE